VRLATILRILSALITFVTFVLVGEFVLGLFGTEFKAGHTVLIILGAAYLPVSAVGPAVLMLNVSGFHNQALKASLFAMVIWLAIAPPMVSTFGIVGAATSGLITLTAWSAALWYCVRRYLSINTLAF
jgi:O-antigen/teichoic acid export membrane protein